MLKKRLIGIVIVKAGWAVQSFGYRRYLPLGKAEWFVENLDRWGADEILLNVIDRSASDLGPDFDLLERIGQLGLETPLIYGGGIRNVEDGVRVIHSGADRVVVDRILRDGGPQLNTLSVRLGAQAVIAAMPMSWNGEALEWFDYIGRRKSPLSEQLISFLDSGVVSEILITDWMHEGQLGEFEDKLVENFPVKNVSLIAFGGLGDPGQMSALLKMPNISAVAVGNFLNYQEHAIQSLKNILVGMPIRPASYEVNEYRKSNCAPT